jgi:alpha-L-arabinofuranosidase
LDGKADYWDYHPWADNLTTGENVEKQLRRMKELFHTWNPNTTMKCAIFEENGNTHNVQRVLGHVTLQNAVRRMGDFVLTSCAANALQPYKQNDNGWDQGQIFFTQSQVWGMPPYYAQQMASNNHLPLLVSSEVDGSTKLDVTATRSEDGKKMVLHVANTGNKDITGTFDIKGFEKGGTVRTITLSGNLKEANSPEEPTKISPVEENITLANGATYDIPAYSYTVFVFNSKQ